MAFSDARYTCSSCRRRYGLTEPLWRCTCGGLLDVEVRRIDLFTGETPATPWSMWRYRDVIPVAGPESGWQHLTLGEGMTPLVADSTGLQLKLDFVMPTGSYKDRGAVMLVTKAAAIGARRLVADSSGNAGVSIAAYAARATIPLEVFVPESTSAKKVDQIRRYGATVQRVSGSRGDAAAAAQARVTETDAVYASHVYDPYFYQGTKTVAYEIWEQLDRRAPDTLVLPVGNGTLVIGASIGFAELLDAGLIPQAPRIVAVQAENCAPLAAAGGHGGGARAEQATLAEGIAISAPPRGAQITEIVRRSGGHFTTVTETAIVQARSRLAAVGIDVEPTAAAAFAASTALGERGAALDQAVVVLTGSGLKSSGQ